MSKIIKGRRTADVAAALDPDATSFVVFHIGMRINKPWRPDIWVPVAMAMPKMVKELKAQPDLGLLGVHQYVGSTITLIQYWRSFDHLERFAKGEYHLPAWKHFGKLMRQTEAVGFYHETFEVPVDNYEVVYSDLPDYGLAAATTNVPISTRGETAPERLGREHSSV